MIDKRETTIRIPRRVLVGAAAAAGLLAALACGMLPGANTVSTAPNPPANLNAALNGARLVGLNWVDASDNEDGFIVQRVDSTAGSASSELGRPGSNETTYSDNTPACDTVYRYYVSSYNAAGASGAVCIEVELPANCGEPGATAVVRACGAAAEAGPPTATQPPTATLPPTPTQFVAPTKTLTPAPSCGDGVCNGSENAASCPGDCPTKCGDGLCTGSENASTCAGDCPQTCGDGFCTGTENASTCAGDCPQVCGDGFCTGIENFSNCSADCTLIFVPIAFCGDGICNGDETFLSCPGDCMLIIQP